MDAHIQGARIATRSADFSPQVNPILLLWNIFFLILATLACPSVAAAATAPFDQANAHYEKREYPEAIRAYESILQQGRSSPALHFNLGNAYFKNKQPGRALLHYREAERLAPRDPDIQANLAFTRDRITGSVSVQPSSIDRLLTYFTVNELVLLSMALFWIFAALFCVPQLRPPLRPLLRRYTTTMGVLWGFSLLWLIAAHSHQNRQTAIVTRREAIIRFGPLEESRAAFTAPEGSELRVIGKKDQWVQVSDRTGRTGWLTRPEAALFPRFEEPRGAGEPPAIPIQSRG